MAVQDQLKIRNLEIVIKTDCQNATIEKFVCLVEAACGQSGCLLL